MIEKELSDIDLKLLVESAFQKLEKTEEIDSKISTEKSNTLNWILALTTLFVGICIQNYKSITTLCLKEELFLAEKIIFAFSVIMLIAYKIVNTNYEKQKKSFLANLHTHKLELLFDLKTKLKPKLTNEQTFIPSFINRFRNGELIPDYDKERKEAFKTIDRKVSNFGKLLKIIYAVTLTAFIINLTITIMLIMNINGG
ncbi:MAG: hypothetical protein HGGPFJEG_00709 [Ignavibacteria bacterium]|nr:hypothetical protein [Ignavibacteria bacterium]